MSNGHSVSVIDDDRSIREAIGALLRSVGFSVAGFDSAEEFLKSGSPASTVCLILDLRMPGMGGLELQHRLSRDGHRVPIIVLSAHADEGARVRAMQAGAVAFLQKPFDNEMLLGTIELVRLR
jgi:FixJ family two-component response regulator